MASSSTPQTSSAMANAQIIIRSPAFIQIFKDLGKNGIKKLNENVQTLKDVTNSICRVAGQAPLGGICVQALAMIIETAAAYIEINDKAKKVIEHAKFLEESMKKIADAGGDDEYLKENCLALLCAEAYEFDNENSRKQSWAKCLCGFICAQCKAKGLDDLADRLSKMNEKMNLQCGVLNVQRGKAIADEVSIVQNQIPTASNAPLGDPSIKLETQEELLTFIRQEGIRFLAVCGMGGIGKTTLLTTLYDQEFPKKPKQDQEFPEKPKQVKAFVEVNMPPTNIKEIQSKILQGLENKYETFTSTQQGQNALRDCLQRLKEQDFSLCLCIDNVWTVTDLQDLLPGDVYQQLPQSSCIMMSTRSHEVAKAFFDICCPSDANINACKLFEPSLFGIQEAEKLFMECAEIRDRNKEKELLKEIVPLCGGLPLALNTYGKYFKRLERRKEGEWRKVKQRIEKASESPSAANGDDKVLGCLEPSIDFQRPVVQDAFIDAALFWRGQHVLMARCAEGEDILEVLLQESLFSSKENQLKCHDLFWAIAQSRAEKKDWKYVTTSKMLVLQEESKVIRAINFRQVLGFQGLEFQILQKNLSIKYIICEGSLTSGTTCNISQGKMHDLKALEVSQYVDLSLLQDSVFQTYKACPLKDFNME